MPGLSPSIAEAVHAACQAGAQEVSEALSRSLDSPMTVEVEAPGQLTLGEWPPELSGPGLVFQLFVGEKAALFLIPESSGLVPAWCAAPDATGQSKLSTLAQELGMLVWVRAADLKQAIESAGVTDGAALGTLPVTAEDGRRGVARLVWPAATPAAIAEPTAEPEAAQAPEPTQQVPQQAPQQAAQQAASNGGRAGRLKRLEELPIYSRSLLRVKVPLVVTLAEKRQPVSRIVELGPGCIIQFDKSCEEMLALRLGNRMIANGEAVKVGDKFGLRITNVVLPEERFYPLHKKSS